MVLDKGDSHSYTTILGFSHSDDGRYYYAKCKCGNTFTISGGRYRYLKKNNKHVGCGCLRGKSNKGNHSKHRLYPIYKTMIARCHNPKNESYLNYGGRGIKVCEKWVESFEGFLEDMEKSYEEGLSIERIDNDGDYTPINCKWATAHEQSLNKRNTLKSINVYKVKDYEGVWKVSKRVFSKYVYLGCFCDFFEACCISLSFKNKVLIGEIKEGDLDKYEVDIYSCNTSGVRGVSWDKSRKKWIAHARKDNIKYYLGRFKSKEDAIHARNKWEEEYLN